MTSGAYLLMLNGRNFAEVMIEEGYAHEYTYRLPYAYQQQFKAAQAPAIAKGAGLVVAGHVCRRIQDYGRSLVSNCSCLRRVRLE